MRKLAVVMLIANLVPAPAAAESPSAARTLVRLRAARGAPAPGGAAAAPAATPGADDPCAGLLAKAKRRPVPDPRRIRHESKYKMDWYDLRHLDPNQGVIDCAGAAAVDGITTRRDLERDRSPLDLREDRWLMDLVKGRSRVIAMFNGFSLQGALFLVNDDGTVEFGWGRPTSALDARAWLASQHVFTDAPWVRARLADGALYLGQIVAGRPHGFGFKIEAGRTLAHAGFFSGGVPQGWGVRMERHPGLSVPREGSLAVKEAMVGRAWYGAFVDGKLPVGNLVIAVPELMRLRTPEEGRDPELALSDFEGTFEDWVPKDKGMAPRDPDNMPYMTWNSAEDWARDTAASRAAHAAKQEKEMERNRAFWNSAGTASGASGSGSGSLEASQAFGAQTAREIQAKHGADRALQQMDQRIFGGGS